MRTSCDGLPSSCRRMAAALMLGSISVEKGKSRSRATKRSPPPASAIAQRRLKRRVDSTRTDGRLRKSDQRWDSILAGAARVFHDVGFAQATLENVAAEVGITRASLYYYVADKRELLIAILDGPIHGMTADLREIQALDLSPRQKLHEAVLTHMKALEDNYPDLFVFLAENLHQMTVGTERDVRLNAREYGQVMSEIIQEGIESGDLRGDLDPTIAMLGLIGMCNWTHRWFSAGGRFTLSEIGEQFAELLLDGMAPRPSSGPSKPSSRRRRT
jgi:AcrR family transcriptional regulator